MSDKVLIGQAEFARQIKALAYRFTASLPNKIWGVPRGGIIVAQALASNLYGGAGPSYMVDRPEDADVIVDDIYDSGKTAERIKAINPGARFEVLFDKRLPEWKGKWLVMPYEVTFGGSDESATDIATRLFEYIGENPEREGLRDTPARWLKAWKEWAVGYGQDPMSLLKVFEDGAEKVNELVVVHNVPIVSKCEHHLADIVGHAHIGYIPSGKIVGLSKLARLADCFARRLQVQERLTNQIADALVTGLEPLGVGVLVRASHACMSSRGVKVHGSMTTTSAMRGALLEKPEARAEFLQLCQMAEQNGGR
jgi:GTP cyclohydrolase I